MAALEEETMSVDPDTTDPGRKLKRLRAQHSSREQSTWRSRLVIALVLLTGIALLTYPVMASWFAQANQTTLGESYQGEMAGFSAEERDEALASARDYNASLTTGAAFDPFTMKIGDEQSQPYAEYLNELKGVPTGVMARIRIPSIGVNLPIYHGTSDEILRLGIGHLFGTALPVGGEGTHSVLTGHSGLADAVLFTNLSRMKDGDRIYIDVYGETIIYAMIGHDTVLPNETDSLAVQADRDLLSLVTCTPIGINSHRYLVHAERVFDEDLTAEQEIVKYRAPEIPGFPWWIVWSVAAVIGAIAYVAIGGGYIGRHEHQGHLSSNGTNDSLEDELEGDLLDRVGV